VVESLLLEGPRFSSVKPDRSLELVHVVWLRVMLYAVRSLETKDLFLKSILPQSTHRRCEASVR
jgi:hypothetical protein